MELDSILLIYFIILRPTVETPIRHSWIYLEQQALRRISGTEEGPGNEMKKEKDRDWEWQARISVKILFANHANVALYIDFHVSRLTSTILSGLAADGARR